MLVVDLLHEFELGVWKAIFTHLIRLLYAAVPAGRLVMELNKRYSLIFSSLAAADANQRFRLIPPFGRSTIRRFSSDASQMKKLAARNFEDLLQVGTFYIGSYIYFLVVDEHMRSALSPCLMNSYLNRITRSS